jgi:site-specific recombinase XerD
MSIYLNERTPNKHKPFDDASPDVVEYVRYLEVIAGKSARTAFNYYCDLRNFSRYMKRRRALVAEDAPMKEIDPKGLDTAFWGSVTKEDIYEYLYFLSSECGNKKSSTARRLASLHGFYDYMVNHIGKLTYNPTASISPPKLDKVLPKYLTEKQSLDLLESTQYHSDFPERDYCMVVLFLNCGMRLSELVGMNLGDIDLDMRQIRLFGKGHKERIVYLNDACMEALESYLVKRNTLEGLLPDEKAVFITRRRKTRITNRRVEQLITGAMEAAGLKGFSTHKLRHTAATLMYQTGHVDILTLKELLGHSNLSTTQIYTHLNGAQVRAAVEANPLGNARTGTETKKSDVQAQFDASGASKIERTEPQNDHPATVVVLPETNGTHLPSEMLYTSDSVDMATESQAPNKKR